MYIVGCNGRIYYVVHEFHSLPRVVIHIGAHNHLVVDGKCGESLEETKRLITDEVNCMLHAKMSTISLSANKTFLAMHLLNGKVELFKGE